jgi:uncharacterized damage-inducible protein DinB
MGIGLSLSSLMEYTDWERGKWHEWIRKHGAAVLKISAGPNGDGRFTTVGDLIKHMFSAEKRYVDRLSGRPITDPASIPNDEVEALFRFGEQSRRDLRDFVETFPAEQWDVSQGLTLMNSVLTVTPRKIVAHVLLHEIRHWAQIATLLRMNGLTDDFHDFLFSPVLGGGIRREQANVSSR